MNLLIIGLSVVFSNAWSGPSHRIIAKAAAWKLSDDARAFLAGHLYESISVPREGVPREVRFGDGMAKVASWADTIKESEEYHYSHTPWRACAEFLEERDCPAGKCLVTGIIRYLQESMDPTISPASRIEAVKFLIHLIGDATQPLHTGFKSDSGAMKIILSEPSGTKLHVFWDFDILDTAMRKYSDRFGACEEEVVQKLLTMGLVDHEVTRDDLISGDFARNLVSYSSKELTCSKAYRDDNGFWIQTGYEMKYEYVFDRAEIVMAQLGRAAAYLAHALNHVGEEYAAARLRLRAPRITTTVAPFVDNKFDPLSVLEEDLAPEEDDQVGEKLRERKKPSIMMGVDLSKLTLVKRTGIWYVKFKAYIEENPMYAPLYGWDHDIVFGSDSTETFRFLFDSRVFEHNLNSKAIRLILKALKGQEVAPDELKQLNDDALAQALALDRQLGKDWMDGFFTRAAKYGLRTSRMTVQGPVTECRAGEFICDLCNSLTLDFAYIPVGRAEILIRRGLANQERYRFTALPYLREPETGKLGMILLDESIECLPRGWALRTMLRTLRDEQQGLQEKDEYLEDQELMVTMSTIGSVIFEPIEERGLFQDLQAELIRIDRHDRHGLDTFEVVVNRQSLDYYTGRMNSLIFCQLGHGVLLSSWDVLDVDVEQELDFEVLNFDNTKVYLDARLPRPRGSTELFQRVVNLALSKGVDFARQTKELKGKGTAIIRELDALMHGDRRSKKHFVHDFQEKDKRLTAYLKPLRTHK